MNEKAVEEILKQKGREFVQSHTNLSGILRNFLLKQPLRMGEAVNPLSVRSYLLYAKDCSGYWGYSSEQNLWSLCPCGAPIQMGREKWQVYNASSMMKETKATWGAGSIEGRDCFGLSGSGRYLRWGDIWTEMGKQAVKIPMGRIHEAEETSRAKVLGQHLAQTVTE